MPSIGFDPGTGALTVVCDENGPNNDVLGLAARSGGAVEVTINGVIHSSDSRSANYDPALGGVTQKSVKSVLMQGLDGDDRLNLSSAFKRARGHITLDGGAGDDLLVGGRASENLVGGEGNDTLSGGGGKDTLDGGAGDDSLAGGKGNDFLLGGNGNDNLRGGAGTNSLFGGAGKNTLVGEPGQNVPGQGDPGNDLPPGNPGGGGLANLVDDQFEVHMNQPSQQLDVLANDVFDPGYTGQRKITSISYGSLGGLVELTPDNRMVIYTPPPDFGGSESFAYIVDNAFAARVTISIVSPVQDDQYELVQASGPVDLNVMANDPFWSNYDGARQIRFVSETSNGGQVEIINGSSIRYTPPPDTQPYDTFDSFSYFVDNDFEAKVSITLHPAVHPDTFKLAEDSTENLLNLTDNDLVQFNQQGHVEDWVNRITSVSAPTKGGTVTITADGQGVLYTPLPGFVGSDQFSYVADGRYQSTVSVNIQTPVQPDSLGVDANSADNLLDLTANDLVFVGRWDDWHMEDHVDRITSVSVPTQGGTVTITADGQGVLYTPLPGFIGSDQFTYIADGRYQSDVTVSVTRPVRDDYLSILQPYDTERLDVLANDFYSNTYVGNRVITSVSTTTQGNQVTIVEDGGAIQFLPTPGFTGTDSFTYTVDGLFDAQVSVYVAPRARNDYYNFSVQSPGHQWSLDVLSNDWLNGDGHITALTDQTGNGSFSISEDGQHVLFTPSGIAPQYSSIHYTVDGRFQAVASVSVSGYLSSDNFKVDQNSHQAILDVLANDDFQNGYWSNGVPQPYTGPQALTDVSASQQGGEVTISPDGRHVLYSPPADFAGTDQFTYTVDGNQQATAYVDVIRRLRDDRFYVAGGNKGKLLPVLVNDDFGTDYAGQRKITDVTATVAGGAVQIIQDGQTIRYTPPTGFTGTDTFIYTVDGQLKAQVSVVVQSSTGDVLPRFRSDAELEQFIIDRAVERYSYLFGMQPYFYWGNNGGIMIDTMADSVTPGHSDTNVQVAGVDEGDIVENDGQYLYVLTSNDLVIVNAWPATSMQVTSRLTVEGSPFAEFLIGDRLAILSHVADPLTAQSDSGGRSDLFPHVAAPVTMTTDSGVTSNLFWQPISINTLTRLTVVDVADRAAPYVIQTADFEGNYVDSRAIDGHVYLVFDSSLNLPMPQLVGSGDSCRYETQDAYVARLQADRAALFDQALPNVYLASGDPSGNAPPLSQLLNSAEDIVKPLSTGADKLVSIVSFDVSAAAPHITNTAGVFTNGASTIYGSLDNVYVFDQKWSSNGGITTPILEFGWGGASGDVQLEATGEVPGRLLNQFSADEFNGDLRLATTIDGWSTYSGRSQNEVFVLRADHGVLEFVGALQNLAPDDTIESVRFLGDRAFVSTFNTIDPLLAIDLSDPTAPRLVGSLRIPGFSSYMQPIDENHLLTIGQNAVAGGSGPTQVSLYDVHDMTHPVLIDSYTFPRFSISEAGVDHHAFGWFPEFNELAIPTDRTYPVREDIDGDGFPETTRWVHEDELQVFNIDVSPTQFSDSGIQLLGTVDQLGTVRRSAYIDDVLYSIANNSIKAQSIHDPSATIGEVTL